MPAWRRAAVSPGSAGGHCGGMTALASPISHRPLHVPAAASVPRLIGGGLVATIGIAILSMAVGGYVVGSAHLLVAAQADEARRLVAGTPMLVAVGLLHLVGAVALVRGRDIVRIGAVFVSGLMALAAAGSVAMIAAGVDPFGGSRAAQGSAGGLLLLLLAALAYGTAAVAAGSGPSED
jgi:hypothetical protein